MTTTRSDTTSRRRSSAQEQHRLPQCEVLIRAAMETIDAEGQEIGTAQVAARAGVNRPHLYRHFASKEELEREVAKAAASALIASVQPMTTQTGTAPQIIEGIVRAAVGWAEDHPHLYRFMATQQQTKATHRARLGRTRFLSVILEASSAYLRAAKVHDVDPPDGIMAGLMGMVDSSIIWWLDHQDEDADQLTRRITRQVWLILADTAVAAGLAVDENALLRLPEDDAVADPPGTLS